MASGFHNPSALIALAMLNLGGYRPALPSDEHPRTRQEGRLSPCTPADAHARARQEILAERLPGWRLRRAPRVVRRKMSNCGVKRAAHRDWPQPSRRPEDAVTIISA
jgi:hypothetical protein